MALETTDGGGFTASGETHTHLVALLAIMRGLGLEINSPSGMRVFRGSAMDAANRITWALDVHAVREATGVKLSALGLKRTKRGALLDLMTYAAIVWRWAPLSDTDSVVRAIGGPDKWAPIARKVAKIHAAMDARTAELEAGK